MGLYSLWSHLLVTQDWSQKDFSSEMRWYVGFSSGRRCYFFPSVVLTCLCTCHLTNRTFGFIWVCWVFSYKHQYKTSWFWRPTFQCHASVSAAPKTPPGYSPIGIGLFWWEVTEAGEPMTRLAFQFISTLWKDWEPMSPIQSSDTKLKFTSAAKRIKTYLEDTEVGILWKTWWWLTVRILQLYCLFSDSDFLFMLICKYRFLHSHFLDTTVIALQKPLQCNHSTYTYMLYR